MATAYSEADHSTLTDAEVVALFDPNVTWDSDQISQLPGAGRHFVYSLHAIIPGVCPIMEDSACVYIGVTSNLRARIRSHSRKWWWPRIHPDLVEFIEYPTRAAAERAEAWGIKEHDPDLNVALGVGRRLSSLVAER